MTKTIKFGGRRRTAESARTAVRRYPKTKMISLKLSPYALREIDRRAKVRGLSRTMYMVLASLGLLEDLS